MTNQSYAKVATKCFDGECLPDRGIEFSDLKTFHMWYNAAELAASPDTKDKNCFDEKDTKLLDDIQEQISDIYTELRDMFREKGFFATDDFYGFTKAIVSSMTLEQMDDNVEDSAEEEYEWADE
jgi:hypothetical protein